MIDQSWLAPKEPVWILKNAVFVKGIVETVSADSAICSTEEGALTQAKKHLIFQRNPAYKEFSKERWDLMDTDVLNEPEILKTLKFRLENERMYTFIENSLLSVNPYCAIPALYSTSLKEFYGHSIIELQESIREFEPHLYSIVAYMLSQAKGRGSSQAVIISGESGAGKTEANKECLRFLQHFFRKEQEGSIDKDIDNILTLSNPILEAFGNSKTIRNNNSSRFGKFLNISINSRLQVKHVKIYNYLLEKSRIISRADNEQNFHIFYELLKGLTKSEKNKYGLESKEGREYRLDDFNYLRTTRAAKYEQHPEISFEKVKESLLTLKDKTAYDFVCRVLAAILLLGNLVPYENENEDRCQIQNEEVLGQVCELLRVRREALKGALTCYQIKIGSEVLTKHFNAREVQELVNSLSKVLYERLFQWIINEINSISHYAGQEQLIGLGFLDIYGFEILESNSLEQLLINYTNERLHQIYLAKIFKDEGELFKREGLAHQFQSIPYSDNMAVLELIDYEQLSIFNLLDEWCSVASPDDSSFITKLRHKHKKHPAFPTANFNLPSTLFLVRHSPKDIEYAVAGFRDKNKDLVRDEIKAALRGSLLPSLAQLFEEEEGKGNHKLKKFLSSKFRHEMSNLMIDLLGSCDLHFIRCVKSNSFKLPMTMEDEVVFNQICYLGVLDTIKLKKLGYCIKLDYEVLDRRFKWLLRYYFTQPAFPKEIAQALAAFLPRFDQDEFIFGKTMVFFRDFAYTALVKKYHQYLQELHRKCRRVQRCLLRNRWRNKVDRRKAAIGLIRGYLRGALQAGRAEGAVRRVRAVQRAVREKLQFFKIEKKVRQMAVMQSYVKKEVCRRSRLRFTRSLQTIVAAIQRYRSWKLVQKYAIVNQLKNYILERSYRKLTLKNKNVVQAYLLAFLTQLGSKTLIMTANLNTRNKFREKYRAQLQQYLLAFLERARSTRLLRLVVRTQARVKTWLYRHKFVKLREAAVVIQRAYREYYFSKNTAKELFRLNFGEYRRAIEEQNESMRSFLYENSINDSLRILYSNYCKKFKEKCSLFYFLIDFQTFLSMEHCYPDNSWLLNYFHIVKDGFEKDSPLQALEVAETFTAAATTNRLYLWGMNTEFNTLDKPVLIKPAKDSRIDRFNTLHNKLEVTYDHTPKDAPRTSSTVARSFAVEGGRLYEQGEGSMRVVRLPQGERVAEVACGSSHVVLRTASKRVFTFGSGREGQLGHGNYFAVEAPRQLEFAELRNYGALQVTASFNSSVLLLANKKVFWFGSNGTLDRVKAPVQLDLSAKLEEYSGGEFAVVRVRASWSRSMSVIGLTLMHFTGKLLNIGLRNKVYEMMIGKWQEQGIDKVNPPFSPSYSDYLEECHVKLPRNKVSVEPESRRALRKLEEKVNRFQSEKYNDISFSDPAFH